MALTTTTLASAVAAGDTIINVASATSFVAGQLIQVEQETMQITKSYVSGTAIPVTRGLDGSANVAHVKTCNVTTYLASDETVIAPDTAPQFPYRRARLLHSYIASGAISPGTPGADEIAVLIGTSTLSMTLAAPTKDMDGNMLYIVSNGKGAHTVTITAGIGGGSTAMDVGTYNTTEQTGCALMALNGAWVLWANGIGSAGTQVAGVVWA